MDLGKKMELHKYALQIRICIMEQFDARGFGHIGGSLSIADILAVLYGAVMNIDPKNPMKPDRDKFVCSKGHAGPAVYAALALKGYFPLEVLKTLNQPGTILPSHCDRNKTPGVDMTTGSLGQGTSLAAGMALGDMKKGRKNRVFLLTGDGELNEGQVWEAAMFITAKRINNLVWIVDNNKKQLDGYVNDVLDPFNVEAKFTAFGFDACTINGNDLEAMYRAVSRKSDGKPIAIILDTIKGQGVKEIENIMDNHSMHVSHEQCGRWISQLQTEYDIFTGKNE